MLLFHLKPKKNESLSGLFYRTARENLMENLSWINDNFYEFSGYQLNNNLINWGELKFIEDLSTFLKISHEDAKKMTFSYHLDFHGLEVDYSKNKVKCPWFLYQTTKVCTKCIQEDPYHRMDWSFTYSIICSKHKLFLKDTCHYCNREINIKTVINDKCSCGMSLSSSKPQNVNNPLVIEYQIEVDKFFLLDKTVKINNWISNSKIFYTSLEFLATWLPQTIDNEAIIVIDHIKYSGNAIARTRLKKSKTFTQACLLYLHSFKILRQWPNSFYEYLNLIKSSENNSNLHIFFDVLNKLIGTSLEPFYFELMNFLLKDQLQNANSEHFICIRRACEITKLKEDAFKKSEFFGLYICTIKEFKFYFINKKDIKSWQSLYNKNITKENLMKIWGTSQSVTFNILSNKVLDQAIHTQIGSVLRWEIPIRTIETFNVRLKKIEQTITDSKIVLNRAFQWVGIHYSHVIIRAMVAGILPFELNKEVFGKSLVSKEMLLRIIRKVILGNAKQKQFISIQDTTFLLGVKKSDIEHWVYTKRFEKNCDNTLTYHSFQKFQSKFCTTYQLSIIKKVSIYAILKKVRNKKIEIVAGPLLNDGKRVLFSTDVIKNV